MLGTFVNCEHCHQLVEDAPICPTCGHEPSTPSSLCMCGQPGCAGQRFLPEVDTVLAGGYEAVGEHVYMRGADRCDNCGVALEHAFSKPCGPR